jgi:tetratricopeptide (TPR) repeat protein
MYPQARKAIQDAVSIDPPNSIAYRNLGNLFYFEHKYPDAVEAYKKSTEINPTDADTWAAYGDAAHYVQGIADVSVDAYTKAVGIREKELAIRPHDGSLKAEIASCRVYTDNKRALREIRTALRLSPNDGRVQILAARVYEQSGMRDKAIAAVETAIRLGYSVEEIQRWPRLENLRQDPRYKRIIASTESSSVPISNNK